MKKNDIKINIPDWKFSCTGCGECRRRWHVALSDDEKLVFDILKDKEMSGKKVMNIR